MSARTPFRLGFPLAGRTPVYVLVNAIRGGRHRIRENGRSLSAEAQPLNGAARIWEDLEGSVWRNWKLEFEFFPPREKWCSTRGELLPWEDNSDGAACALALEATREGVAPDEAPTLLISCAVEPPRGGPSNDIAQLRLVAVGQEGERGRESLRQKLKAAREAARNQGAVFALHRDDADRIDNEQFTPFEDFDWSTVERKRLRLVSIRSDQTKDLLRLLGVTPAAIVSSGEGGVAAGSSRPRRFGRLAGLGASATCLAMLAFFAWKSSGPTSPGLLWSCQLGQSPQAVIPLLRHGRVDTLVGDTADGLVALSARTGAAIWETSLRSPSGSHVPAGDWDGDNLDDIAVLTSQTLWLLSGTRGDVLRQWPCPGVTGLVARRGQSLAVPFLNSEEGVLETRVFDSQSPNGSPGRLEPSSGVMVGKDTVPALLRRWDGVTELLETNPPWSLDQDLVTWLRNGGRELDIREGASMGVPTIVLLLLGNGQRGSGSRSALIAYAAFSGEVMWTVRRESSAGALAIHPSGARAFWAQDSVVTELEAVTGNVVAEYPCSPRASRLPPRIVWAGVGLVADGASLLQPAGSTWIELLAEGKIVGPPADLDGDGVLEVLVADHAGRLQAQSLRLHRQAR